MFAVQFVDPQHGWAIGDISPTGGSIFETSDGGQQWRPIARTLEVLTSLHFISRSRGWVAGFAGRIERTDDGGRTWVTQRTEKGNEALNSIFFANAQRGWVAGSGGLLLRTISGGDTWESLSTDRVEDFWTVRFRSEQVGWIVGEDGLILRTTDGGSTWVQMASGTRLALYGLALGPTFLIAVGEKGLILRSEDGFSWKQVESGTNETLNAVSAADEDVVWAVGSSGTTIGSRDGGRSWTLFPPVSRRALLGLAVTGPMHGVAVGRKGALQALGP